MNCSQFQETLPGLEFSLDGSSLSKEVAAHLELCPSCRNEWQWATGISSVFREMEDPLPSPRLSQPVFETLFGTSGGIRGGILALGSRIAALFPVIPDFAPALVVLFMVTGVGLALLSSGGPDQKNTSVSQIIQPEERFEIQHQDLWPPVTGLLREVAIEPVAPLNRPSSNPGEGAGVTPLSMGELEKLHRDRKAALLEQDADSLLMRGRRYKSMGRVDLALRDFETIYRFYPNYLYMGDVLMYRAQCLAFQGEFDRAIDSLETYLRKEPAKTGLVQPMIDQLKLHQTRTE